MPEPLHISIINFDSTLCSILLTSGLPFVKSANDLNSPVAGLDNLAKTCEQCHAGAGVEFARGFLGHKEASPDNIPVAHYTEIIFKTLLTSVLSFGALVVIMAIFRFSANRWRD